MKLRSRDGDEFKNFRDHNNWILHIGIHKEFAQYKWIRLKVDNHDHEGSVCVINNKSIRHISATLTAQLLTAIEVVWPFIDIVIQQQSIQNLLLWLLPVGTCLVRKGSTRRVTPSGRVVVWPTQSPDLIAEYTGISFRENEGWFAGVNVRGCRVVYENVQLRSGGVLSSVNWNCETVELKIYMETES